MILMAFLKKLEKFHLFFLSLFNFCSNKENIEYHELHCGDENVYENWQKSGEFYDQLLEIDQN